ncbi:MAG: 3-oxoacyl-ACP reductase FabG [Defluviitaleaceae bacterium]|nr:3-oxoacyl-ACP reductase FabG [Defluviitaleaceae bacterium]MCL2837260.1 3-oxoacyl-ACP reductase FabG [Defluviitaleaceae bacterium]
MSGPLNVLITGGGRGIGRACALRFAKEGANVAVNEYAEVPDGLAEEIESLGGKMVPVLGDVSVFTDAARIIKETVSAFGRIDVLVNNAGILRDNLIIRMTEDDFDNVIAVNLKGAFNMTKHAASVMLKQRGGAIVNMASVAGLGGNIGQANYSASKAGLIGLTKTTAAELGSRGITCNAVAPGPLEVGMTETLSDDIRQRMLAQIPLGRFGKLDEIADTVYFLAVSKYITGEVIRVDGGLMLL